MADETPVKGGITSLGTGGAFQTDTSEADYPAEADVLAGVEYGDGTRTGTLVLQPEIAADDAMEGAMSAIRSVFGELVRYVPKTGSAVNITSGYIDRERKKSEIETGGRGVTHTALVWVPITSVADPVNGDTVVFDGYTWEIRGIMLSAGGGGWDLTVCRFARDGFRYTEGR